MIETRSAKSIAIVTASPPGENGVGQNYMRDLVAAISDQHVHVVALLKDGKEWRSEDRTGIASHEILPQQYEHAKGVGSGPLSRLSSEVAFRVVTMQYAERLAARLAASFKQRAIHTVLIVLESPLLMLIGEQLARRGEHRLCLLVWDHPDHVARYFGHRGAAARRLIAAVTHTCLGAVSALTVSAPLQQYLSVLSPSLAVQLFRSPVMKCGSLFPRSNALEGKDFVIGFAGSVTAPEELELLQCALDSLEWQVDGRPIILRLFGKRFTLRASSRRNVHYCGFLPNRSDVVAALALCDICFLPQPFSPTRRLFAEFSLPTKLSSYLASGAPVLAVTPSYGSVANFCPESDNMDEHESAVGFSCTESSSLALRALIRRLVQDRAYYDRGVGRAHETAERYFSRGEGSRRVRQCLSVPGDLVAIQPSEAFSTSVYGAAR